MLNKYVKNIQKQISVKYAFQDHFLIGITSISVQTRAFVFILAMPMKLHLCLERFVDGRDFVAASPFAIHFC